MAKRGGRSGRKYVRDNRGRFATTGATARGGRLKTASGKKRATQTVKAKIGGKPAGAIKGKIKRSPGAAGRAGKVTANSARAAAKPAAAKRKAAPKDGTDFTREIGRAKGNKRIKNLNQQIKEAGPNAAGLRLQKLSVQTRMPNKPRQRMQPTAKQLAKEASRNDAIRKRSAELRAQSVRLAEAKATGLSMIKVTKPKRRRS